jgi:hypothetical protein
VVAEERKCIDASLLLETVLAIEVDRGLVCREDHEDVGAAGSEACVVFANQRAPDSGVLLSGIDVDAVKLGSGPLLS